jgi:hypothetical protein
MKKLFCLGSLLLLAACAETLDVETKPVNVNWSQPADPAPVKMATPAWKIINEQNVNQIIAELGKNNNGRFTIIAISPEDYQALMIDFADLKRYIEQQKAIIVYYKNITKN